MTRVSTDPPIDDRQGKPVEKGAHRGDDNPSAKIHAIICAMLATVTGRQSFETQQMSLRVETAGKAVSSPVDPIIR